MNAKELLDRYAAGEIAFRGANLRGCDLRGCDLRWADLSGANLNGADLSEANLRWADLSGADLRGTDLSEANLRWAGLTYIRFESLKHELTAIKGQIQIGCEIHPTEWWLENYVSVGKKNGYSEDDIAAYGKVIKMCAEYFADVKV